MRSIIEDHPLGPTVAAELYARHCVEHELGRRAHHPMPLSIVIQFWEGDQEEALRLARLLTDLEYGRRYDVLLVFGRRFDVEMSEDLWETGLYCASKFLVQHRQSRWRGTGHPDGPFGLWAGVVDGMWKDYCKGLFRWPNVFMLEADGAPTARDWIDKLKQAHAATLAQHKRVTGPRMESGFALGAYTPHVNGAMVLHLSLWGDRLSLHRCPPGQAWDVVHGPVFLAECGELQPIFNPYAGQDLSESMFHTLAREYAWIANCKDGNAQRWARTLLCQPDYWTRQRQAGFTTKPKGAR